MRRAVTIVHQRPLLFLVVQLLFTRTIFAFHGASRNKPTRSRTVVASSSSTWVPVFVYTSARTTYRSRSNSGSTRERFPRHRWRSQQQSTGGTTTTTQLYYSNANHMPNSHHNNEEATSTQSLEQLHLSEIAQMKVADIRNELESYGISTRAFLEKKEMVQALQRARIIRQQYPPPPPPPHDLSRQERIEQEMKKAENMTLRELTKQLRSVSISTQTFFEKREFVQAYAEAIVDGRLQPIVTTTESRADRNQVVSEVLDDPSYRDVEVQRMGQVDRSFMAGGILIDIQIR